MSGWYAPRAGLAVIEDGGPPGVGQAGPEGLDDPAERIAHRRTTRRARTVRVATGAAGICGLLLIWQAAAMILSDQVALPSVTQTAAQFLHYLNRPYPAQGKPLWFDLYISVRRILVGFVLGVAGWHAGGSAA